MTDQTNAELIAFTREEIEGLRRMGEHDWADALEGMMDALEAAEKRAEENRKEIDRLSRELQVAEDQANNLAGDLAQAEQERDTLEAAERLQCGIRCGLRRPSREGPPTTRGEGMSDLTDADQLADVFASFAVSKNPTGLSLGIDSAYELGDHIASTWLAAHDAKVQAEALREFANSIPGDVHDPRRVAELARGVADHIEREAGLR